MVKIMLEEILSGDNVVDSIKNNIDVLVELVPEIKFMFNFPHNHPHHHLDVWNHTLLSLSNSVDDFEVRLALLLHDIGKPFSYQDEEVRHFRGHPHVSSIMSRDILKRLDYDYIFIDRICYLVENHDNPISEIDVENDYDINYKRYLIQECDCLAHNPEKLTKRVKYLEKVKKYFNSK